MTELRQEEGALRRAADLAAEARGGFETRQRQLAGQIEDLRARWQGEGGGAFQRVHLAWQEKQTRVTRALGDLEAALRETERDTVVTDQAEGARLGRYAHRL